LNEATDGSCRKVFKPWDQRLATTSDAQLGVPALCCRVAFDVNNCLDLEGVNYWQWTRLAATTVVTCADSAEDDPELLLHVPFDGAVKLTGITVIGGPDGTSPAKLKVCSHLSH
jgi:hypothetical protein